MKRNQSEMSFERRAATYDGGYQGQASQRFYSLLLQEVTMVEGMRILDVGCGTGTVLRAFADRCPIEGCGIDIAENMVRLAKRKCPEMDIQRSGCEHTPFADHGFDVLIVCMAYHHFSDKPGFAREAARIIKPGGHLYIADGNLPEFLRRVINGGARLFRIAAEFQNQREIEREFAPYGFALGGCVADGMAQIVELVREPV